MTSQTRSDRSITQAIVSTEHGTRYMRRLCKHFAHKVETTINDNDARMELPFGTCQIDVDETSMRLRIELDETDQLARAEKVITDHLLRMADRDEPEIIWQRSDDQI